VGYGVGQYIQRATEKTVSVHVSLTVAVFVRLKDYGTIFAYYRLCYLLVASFFASSRFTT
jgi:hypothetical protein